MNMKNIIITLYNKHRHFILYGIFGGICASLDFGIYTLLCVFGTNYLIANIIGIHCGIFCSFLLNKYITFKVKDKTMVRFLSFYIVGLGGLALSSGMLYWLITLNGFNVFYTKLLTIVVVALLQFFLNKFITFKKSK